MKDFFKDSFEWLLQNQPSLSEAFSLIFLPFATTFCWKDFCANSHNTFVKNMLKWRVGKQLHWSFMWLKGSESFCGKPFVLKESAQYSSSFLATTLSANSTKKIWVNGRTFFCNNFIISSCLQVTLRKHAMRPSANFRATIFAKAAKQNTHSQQTFFLLRD